MPAYIGDIYLPNVAAMPESQEGNVEEMIGLGLNAPITNTHAPEPMKLKIQGYLFKRYGTVKTAEDYAEDIQALLRDASFNSMNFGRVGYLELEDVPRLDRMGDNQLLIPYTIDAIFHPDSQFQRRLKSSPEILANDFSITFGAGGCDNYIPLPIGSIYSGGDGSTITRAGKDGTVTLVKANTSKNINFDLTADEINVGECKIWDSVVAGDSNENNWIRVYNKDHKFTGDLFAENGMVRVKLYYQATRRYFSFYYYVNGGWQSFPQALYMDSNGSEGKNIYEKRIVEVNPDNVIVELINFNDGNIKQYVEIMRGKPYFFMYTANRGGATDRQDTVTPWGADVNAFRFAYLPKTSPTLRDGMFDTATPYLASSDPDNWGLQIDPSWPMVIGAASHAVNSANNGLQLVWSSATNKYSILNLTKGNNKSIPFYVNISGAKLFKECESMSQGSGVTFYTGVDASPKTGNTGSILDAQTENIYHTLVAGTDLPLGTYKLFIRAKDSSQIANDLRIKVENQTDATTLANVTKTLTAAFAYYSTDVTLGSADNGDTIKLTLSKDVVTANTITLDYVLWVPITLDSGNGPQQIAHQAIVNQRMKRDLILR